MSEAKKDSLILLLTVVTMTLIILGIGVYFQEVYLP